MSNSWKCEAFENFRVIHILYFTLIIVITYFFFVLLLKILNFKQSFYRGFCGKAKKYQKLAFNFINLFSLRDHFHHRNLKCLCYLVHDSVGERDAPLCVCKKRLLRCGIHATCLCCCLITQLFHSTRFAFSLLALDSVSKAYPHELMVIQKSSQQSNNDVFRTTTFIHFAEDFVELRDKMEEQDGEANRDDKQIHRLREWEENERCAVFISPSTTQGLLTFPLLILLFYAISANLLTHRYCMHRQCNTATMYLLYSCLLLLFFHFYFFCFPSFEFYFIC